MKKESNKAYEENVAFFVVIYYSGHGVIIDQQTFGLTGYNELGPIERSHFIPIEEYTRKISIRPNTFVLSILDCCRSVEM